ncbi:VWA domain-containing protein [Acidobacteria bacterium AH-259-D05]|nr:VWA domain-containing protein [Acidobacteria bacterium AH-259-D05]
MYFDRAAYLWLLALLPLLWFLLRRYVLTGRLVWKMWGGSTDSSLLPPGWRDSSAAVLVVLGYVCVVVALAGPYLQEVMENPEFQKKNLVFLLDVSPSMNTQDVWPSRLERAKEVIHQFIQRETEVVRFGLVSFSESSVILSYLTSDPQNLLFYLDFLRPDRRIIYGTDIGAALASGLQVLDKHQQREEANPLFSDEKSVLILLSDGEDHGESLKTSIQEALDGGIGVHVIGVGTSQGGVIPLVQEDGTRGYLEDGQGVRLISKLTVDTLREIARETGGKFFRAGSGPELEEALEAIMRAEREVTGYRIGPSRRDILHYFVGFAFISQLLVMTLRF